MAGVWALENALLIGCYAFGAGITAAAGRVAAVRQQTSAPMSGHPSPPPLQQGAETMSDGPARSNTSRRTRRGKPTRVLHSDDHNTSPNALDEVLSTSVASTGTGHASTVPSDGFRSCVSATTDGGATRSRGSIRAPRRGLSSESLALAALEPLPRCSDDLECGLLNDPSHYTRFRHTCRLVSCPMRQRPEHCEFFDHVGSDPSTQPLLAAQPLDCLTPSSSYSPPPTVTSTTARLTGVSLAAGKSATGMAWSDSDSASPSPHAHIYHDSVDATPALICWESNGEERRAMVCGDWRRVTVHTFKQHLKQIIGIPPASQLLRASLPSRALPPQRPVTSMTRGRGSSSSPTCRPAVPSIPLEVFMTDDLATVASYLDFGIFTGSSDDAPPPPMVTISRDEGRIICAMPQAPQSKNTATRRRR